MPEIGLNNLKLIEYDIRILVKGEIEAVDFDFSQACRCLNREIADYEMPYFVERNIEPVDVSKSNKLLLLFSGGKVSLATALMLRELHKDVTLFHIQKNEELSGRVLEMATMLKLPLVMSENTIHGDYEKYFYGMCIAHQAVTYAIEHGYSPSIYMGCFCMASVLNNYKKDWQYCSEFIGTYNDVVKRYVNGAEIIRLLPGYSVVEDEFIRYKEYLEFFAKPS